VRALNVEEMESLLEWAYCKGALHGMEKAELKGENAELRGIIATLKEALREFESE
jgi:hypothetical protein